MGKILKKVYMGVLEILKKYKIIFKENNDAPRFKIGIKRKLFLVTAIIFALFITTNLVINSLFFEKFYERKITSEMESISQKLKHSYDKLNKSDDVEDREALNNTLKEFEDEYPIKIIILDENLKLIALQKTQPSRDDVIKTKELTQFILNFKKDPELSLNIDSIKAKTVTINDLRAKEKRIVSIMKASKSNDKIFIIRSLQPVNDAASTIKEFYIYSYGFAILFIILLSFIFSKMITKPLLTINKTATKMSKLDFESKCHVNTRDEFENVAESLNFLSENLDNALTSLKEANIKLANDIDKERRLEAMRKEFIAAISHELKTPITLIDGYAVGLKDEIFEDEDKDFYLDVIIDESRKMASLVSEMLELSHLESGNFKLQKKEFNIGDFIQDLVKKYTGPLNEKELTLKSYILDKIIYADINKIDQVITNFITNAIKNANRNGQINVLMQEVQDGLRISVENTGSHINEEELKLIWERFYKIDKSRNRKLGGTGLGLSITKNILEHHNFPYGVRNTDVGVEFYFMVNKDSIIDS
ncbi:HAMP domain-containing protein [Clostridium cavendishii DSM 21758]|uniref:histidine kinase n=1 Tax=Clostridium cavendishii DSM 21758 TaxID=1121302 RepID=A0A1M6F0H8_9CLOT|nr:HAMP domain-containing sensor histidine kinase [Clostridium cavendishii]SHI91244.1 HAMP domain-containing protein [Clostridium cavendishii DSM 21758]